MSWNLTDTVAQRTLGRWKASAQLHHPEKGWHAEIENQIIARSLLAIETSDALAPVGEVYCNLDQLVVNYPQPSDSQGISVEVRYQAMTLGDTSFSLQATYALHTQNFEAKPALQIRLPGNAQSAIDSIVAWQADRLHLALVIAPEDAAQGELICTDNETSLRWLGDFLERGVLRKLRLRLIVASSPIDQQTQEQQLQDLIDQPLPLVS